ncbi:MULTISPECIES: GntR family transcriptional regulator [Thalassospira]|uniref:GntR family transcriptional regulator n=2 Tax=Thalassospira TaxID=168934 RepID=A0A367VWV4_9PROT|nr:MULTISPECIES: GntR family transcriptional regulator [Thalassospira]MDG4717820.1 GntR family transcriptional regulator [Thalassospira sp. FZY0004]RCK30338.1 GntR family transcriptional regulator [Thalassospira profundimaris]
MTKANTRFKESFNQCLGIIDDLAIGAELPGEVALADALKVSRTTVRNILTSLNDLGIIDWQGRAKVILRHSKKDEFFSDQETSPISERIEGKFLKWILHGDIAPDAPLNELELARQFNVGTSSVREFLINFSRFGLIDKKQNQRWVLRGFTKEYALELSDVREMFELHAVRSFVDLPDDHAAWKQLDKLESQHLKLLDQIDTQYSRFSELDARFHATLNRVSNNRFVDEFQDIISLIFHYHYQWNKKDEKERNEAAILEHLAYIKALRSRNWEAIKSNAIKHLGTAKNTLLRSLNQN